MKNIPNQITISRVLLIFVFVVFSGVDSVNPNCFRVSEKTAYTCHFCAIVIAFIAALTDLLDGYLARKMKVESDFGRLIDPLADKIFMLATFTMMVAYNMIPGWFFIIIFAREFMVTGLRTLAAGKGIVISADRWGKLKTASQMFMLAVGGGAWLGFYSITQGPGRVIWWTIMGAVTIITMFSGLGYFIRNKKLYLESL